MAENQVLFEHHGIQLIRMNEPDAELKAFVGQTILGTPGRMRYAHTQSLEKMSQLKNAWFFKLKLKSATVGSLVLVHRSIVLDNKKISALYVRYFAIRAPFRSKREANKYKKSNSGLLKNFIQLIFNDPYAYVPALVKNEPLLIYAFVEEGNSRSQNMVDQMGMERIGSFKTLLFSRRKPKSVVKLSESISEQDMAQFYKNHQLLPDRLNFDPKNSFTFQPDTATAIGFSVEKNRWIIHEIPGITGWFFQHILPKIPLLKDYFDGNYLDFVTLENLHWKGTAMPHLPGVLETICARYQVTKMLLWFDENSESYQDILMHSKVGILNKLINFKPAKVYGKTFNLNRSMHKNQFVYVSPMDIT